MRNLLFRSWCTGIHTQSRTPQKTQNQIKRKCATNPQEVLPTKLITTFTLYAHRKPRFKDITIMELAIDALDGASVAYDEIKPTLDAMSIQLNESTESASVTLDKYSEWAYHTIEEKADTMFESNDEIKPALDAMSIQLNEFNQSLSVYSEWASYTIEEGADFIFDYIEADGLIDTVGLEEQYLERSKSRFVSGAPLPRYDSNMSSPPKGKVKSLTSANKKLTKGLKASSATETKLNRDVNTLKIKVATLESGEANKKRDRLAHQLVKRKIAAAKEKQLGIRGKPGIRGNPGRKNVTKGLKKTRRPVINNHSAPVASSRKKPIGSSAVKMVSVKTKNKIQTETREVEEAVSQKTAFTANTKSLIHGAIQESEEREGIEASTAASGTTTATTTATTTIGKEDTTETPNTANVETSEAAQLNKFKESASQVYNQTADCLTTACIEAEKDLSLISIALTETKAAKSLNALMKGKAGELIKEEDDGVEVSKAASTTTTSGNEVVEKCGGPLSNDAGSNAVNEETTEAPSNVNAETPKTDDEMPTQLNQLSESVSLVSNETVNGLTTAYVRVGEDLSLIGIALSQTNAAKSLNTLIKGEVDYDQENEGEGMEISLDNRIGNSRTVAEI